MYCYVCGDIHTFIHLYFPVHLIQLKSREEKQILITSVQNSQCNYRMAKLKGTETPEDKRERNGKIGTTQWFFLFAINV